MRFWNWVIVELFLIWLGRLLLPNTIKFSNFHRLATLKKYQLRPNYISSYHLFYTYHDSPHPTPAPQFRFGWAGIGTRITQLRPKNVNPLCLYEELSFDNHYRMYKKSSIHGLSIVMDLLSMMNSREGMPAIASTFD